MTFDALRLALGKRNLAETTTGSDRVRRADSYRTLDALDAIREVWPDLPVDPEETVVRTERDRLIDESESRLLADLPLVGHTAPEYGRGWLIRLPYPHTRTLPLARAGWKLSPSGRSYTIAIAPER